MPIIFQKRIYRDDLKANPDVLYLFGDNHVRLGLGGQAGEMRGEPNAVGVRTKMLPNDEPYAFFSDDNFEEHVEMITEDLQRAEEHLKTGGTVVVPFDGLGTGLSQLPQRAPRLDAFIKKYIGLLREEHK